MEEPKKTKISKKPLVYVKMPKKPLKTNGFVCFCVQTFKNQWFILVFLAISHKPMVFLIILFFLVFWASRLPANRGNGRGGGGVEDGSWTRYGGGC